MLGSLDNQDRSGHLAGLESVAFKVPEVHLVSLDPKVNWVQRGRLANLVGLVLLVMMVLQEYRDLPVQLVHPESKEWLEVKDNQVIEVLLGHRDRLEGQDHLDYQELVAQLDHQVLKDRMAHQEIEASPVLVERQEILE